MKKRILALTIGLLVSACGGSSDDATHTESGSNHSASSYNESGSNHSTSSYNESGSNHSAPSYNEEFATRDMEELELQREKWSSLGYHDYQFTYDMSCTCFPPVSFETSVVLVQDGEISEAFEIVSGVYVPEHDYGQLRIQTIEDWFNYTESLIASVPDMLQIRYNDEFGYPESISYDLHVDGSDDEASYRLSELY